MRTEDYSFYSMLYQSMLAPTLLSDVSGNYKAANDSIGHADGFDRYDTFSLWDTLEQPIPFIYNPPYTKSSSFYSVFIGTL